VSAFAVNATGPDADGPSYKAAVRSPERLAWLDGMREEMSKFERFSVSPRTPSPTGTASVRRA
jgi:hypothetical protein